MAVLVGVISALSGLAGTVFDRLVWAFGAGWEFFGEGLALVTAEPDRLYHTFVRSGRIPEFVDYRVNRQEAIELTVLETAPLLAGVVGTVAVGLRRGIAAPSLASIRRDLGRPVRQADLLAVALAAVFVVVNLPRLPLQTQITVRHLLPIFPLGVYGIARLPAVRDVATEAITWLSGTYLIVVVVGGLTLLVAHGQLDLAVGEAMQLHALLALASAGPVAVWSLLAGGVTALDDRIGAVALAVPAALTTLFLLFTGFVYFQYGQYALPIARLLTDWLPVAV